MSSDVLAASTAPTSQLYLPVLRPPGVKTSHGGFYRPCHYKTLGIQPRDRLIKPILVAESHVATVQDDWTFESCGSSQASADSSPRFGADIEGRVPLPVATATAELVGACARTQLRRPAAVATVQDVRHAAAASAHEVARTFRRLGSASVARARKFGKLRKQQIGAAVAAVADKTPEEIAAQEREQIRFAREDLLSAVAAVEQVKSVEIDRRETHVKTRTVERLQRCYRAMQLTRKLKAESAERQRLRLLQQEELWRSMRRPRPARLVGDLVRSKRRLTDRDVNRSKHSTKADTDKAEVGKLKWTLTMKQCIEASGCLDVDKEDDDDGELVADSRDSVEYAEDPGDWERALSKLSVVAATKSLAQVDDNQKRGTRKQVSDHFDWLNQHLKDNIVEKRPSQVHGLDMRVLTERLQKESQILAAKYQQELMNTKASAINPPQEGTPVNSSAGRLSKPRVIDEQLKELHRTMQEKLQQHLCEFSTQYPRNMVEAAVRKKYEECCAQRKVKANSMVLQRIGAACSNVDGSRSYDFSHSHVSDRGISCLLHALALDPQVVELSFRACGLREAGAELVACFMELHPRLRHIDLSDNDLSFKAGELILNALKRRPATLAAQYESSIASFLGKNKQEEVSEIACEMSVNLGGTALAWGHSGGLTVGPPCGNLWASGTRKHAGRSLPPSEYENLRAELDKTQGISYLCRDLAPDGNRLEPEILAEVSVESVDASNLSESGLLSTSPCSTAASVKAGRAAAALPKVTTVAVDHCAKQMLSAASPPQTASKKGQVPNDE